MNRSSTKTDAASAPGFWERIRQLLRAFADAGQQQSTNALQLSLGPNGGLIWIEAPHVDRSEPYAVSVLTLPEKSAAPVDGKSPVTIRADEPAEILAYAPLEAPASN